MIGEEALRDLLSQYERFGWKLDRVLLNKALRQHLEGSEVTLFGSAPVIDSDINAAWFSRPTTNEQTAWELRALDHFPFALVEVVKRGTLASDVDEIFRKTEERLRDRMKRASN